MYVSIIIRIIVNLYRYIYNFIFTVTQMTILKIKMFVLSFLTLNIDITSKTSSIKIYLLFEFISLDPYSLLQFNS